MQESTDIKKYVEAYKKYTQSIEGKEDINHREERKKFFSNLTKKKLLSWNELEFGQIISSLWATTIWGNKEYLTKKIITENGFDNIKSGLAHLFFEESTPISERYDKVNIKYLGPASITEMLCYVNPKIYGIWNDKARNGLKILGYDEKLNFLDKYKIKGIEYEKFNGALEQIAKELEQNGLPNVDLLVVDYFLYELENLKNGQSEVKVINPERWEHDEIRDYIREGVLRNCTSA